MSRGKLIAVCVVWLVVLGIGVLAWRLIIAPARQSAIQQQQQQDKEQKEKARQEELKKGGTSSRYRYTINLYLDSFSGYALLRSEYFAQQLGDRGIRLQLHDDGANYLARIQALASGQAQMATFTIDALVKVCAQIRQLPATIVALIDETTGADAIVAYRGTVPNVAALNRPDMRFVLVPNSPSESLVRIVMSRFELDQLAADPFILVADPQQVVEHYKRAKPSDPVAYVAWEPFVSKILANDETGLVVDSSRFPSTIVDVLVASDDVVTKNPEVVNEFVESYLRTVYFFRERDKLLQLLQDDAQKIGDPLTVEQAGKIVDGVWWKNTQENLAHMGYLSGKGLPHIEDMITEITRVLRSTGAIDRDPTAGADGEGHPNYLYHPNVLAQLREFHPGTTAENVREIKLPALSDAQWNQLEPVGTARVSPLVFARGTDRLTERSRRVLDDLAGQLKTTRYYVLVRGNASQQGDSQKNRELAEQRAKAAEQYLISKGIDPQRIRTTAAQLSGSTSVTFELGQVPY